MKRRLGYEKDQKNNTHYNLIKISVCHLRECNCFTLIGKSNFIVTTMFFK